MAILLSQSSSAGITGACPQDEQKLVLEPDAGNTRSSRGKHDPHADTALHRLPSAFIPFRFVPCVCGLQERAAHNRVLCDVEPQVHISRSPATTLLGQGLPLKLELRDSAGLVGQWPQGHLCPRLLSPGIQTSTILYYSGSQLRSSCLDTKHFPATATFPSPLWGFFNFSI